MANFKIHQEKRFREGSTLRIHLKRFNLNKHTSSLFGHYGVPPLFWLEVAEGWLKCATVLQEPGERKLVVVEGIHAVIFLSNTFLV